MHKSFIAAVSLLCILSCQRDRFIQITGYAQGGTYEVKCRIDGKSGINPASLKQGIDSILNVIDRSVSGYNKASLLSRYNDGENITNDGSAEYIVFSHLEKYCDSLYLITGGALDTRAAALFDAWGFGFKDGHMPDDETIEIALQDRSRNNFNAVAQGYSADKVAEYLAEQGISDMMVNVGGEIHCNGLNPSGKPWTFGIDAPVDGNMNPGENLSGTFSVPPGGFHGVVTSGNYRKYYMVDGVKYSHTVDPRTGRPVTHNLLSATVIAGDAAFADAMATYFMVIGTEKAKQFIEGRDDLEACLISGDGMWCSGGFTVNQ